MMVREPDSEPNFGARPGAEPKNCEILKFGNLTFLKVFGDINSVGIKYA